MYINTFKYTPADVDCKLCTEYVKKFGCTACGCPWMAERIEAGVVGYHLYGSDIYADDGNVYGGIRHSGKHFFSARIGVSDCKQPDKS